MQIATETHLNLAADMYQVTTDMINHKSFAVEMEEYIKRQIRRAKILQRLAEFMTTKHLPLIEVFRNYKPPT